MFTYAQSHLRKISHLRKKEQVSRIRLRGAAGSKQRESGRLATASQANHATWSWARGQVQRGQAAVAVPTRQMLASGRDSTGGGGARSRRHLDLFRAELAPKVVGAHLKQLRGLLECRARRLRRCRRVCVRELPGAPRQRVPRFDLYSTTFTLVNVRADASAVNL